MIGSRGRHAGITWASHGRYVDVTWASYGCQRGVHGRHPCVKRVSRGRYAGITWASHERHTGITGASCGDHMGVNHVAVMQASRGRHVVPLASSPKKAGETICFEFDGFRAQGRTARVGVQLHRLSCIIFHLLSVMKFVC